MSWLPYLTFDVFIIFTLVLVRVSGLVMTAPVFGTTDVPMHARALLAFTLALLIAPTQLAASAVEPGTLVNFGVIVAGELLLGVALGLGVMVLFSGAQLAGQIIGQIGGMSMASIFDPALGEEVPQVSKLLFLLAMAVFVAIGGHRAVMSALLDTFAGIPPGGAAVSTSLADTFQTLLTQSFALGIRAAAPVMTALLLATLVLGLVSRTLPQLNVLMVGFGLNAVLMFAALMLSIGAAAWLFQEQVGPSLELLMKSLHRS
jgi:flagellar biosynthetic protein FliR